MAQFAYELDTFSSRTTNGIAAQGMRPVLAFVSCAACGVAIDLACFVDERQRPLCDLHAPSVAEHALRGLTR
jgi:hypothetical protein